MLVIYGVPNSQPVRAVIWTCLMKGLPFELRMTSQNRDAKRPEYLQLNPRGTIPAIDDEGFVLWESHAIMTYLCEKHEWFDLWPEEIEARSRVNQYLHFHHRNTREIVAQWSRSLWPAVFGISTPDYEWLRENTFVGAVDNECLAAQSLDIIEDALTRNHYLSGPTLTLSDISAYEELGQNQSKFANCTDYSGFPSITRWLRQMEEMPYHAEAHAVWDLLGNVARITGGMHTVARANKEAARILDKALQQLPFCEHPTFKKTV